MKILAVSDTHLTGKFPPALLEAAGTADIVVHAGDFSTRAAYESLRDHCKKLVAVHGNSDSQELQKLLPGQETFVAEGIRFGVVHSGKHTSDLTNMRYMALEMGVGALIFGHLHRPIIEKSDVLLVCPGSPTHPRMSDPSVVEIEVVSGNISGRILKMSTGDTCGYIQFARSLKND